VSERTQRQMVLFVLIPWAGVGGGSLGISTLKAVLNRDGIDAENRYLNIRFARRIGLDLCGYTSERALWNCTGEVFFAPYFYNLPLEEFIRGTLSAHYAGGPGNVHASPRLFSYVREPARLS
jgi:hypothetical protein